MRIVIVRTDRLGDVILTLPMARAIKEARPDAEVVFLVRKYTEQIVQRVPDIDEVVIYEEAGALAERVRLFRDLRADAIFFPNAKFDQVFQAYLARIPMRVATAYRWYSPLLTHRVRQHRRTADRNEAEYNLAMLSKLSIDPDPRLLPHILLHPQEVSLVDAWIAKEIPTSKFAVLHVTSSGSSKDWPTERFAEFGKWLAHRLAFSVVLTGLETDSEQLLSIAGAMRSGGATVRLFLGRSLPELAALLSRAALVVSNSTGPGHLAAATGAPTIGLFPLPTALSKERWGFRGNTVLNLSPEPLPTCPTCSDCTCMKRLTTAYVEQEVVRFLKSAE